MGEGFELGISCLNPSLMLMIQLGKTGSHFAAAGSGSGYDNEGSGSFHILIPAIAFIADDKINIIGIAFDHIMKEGTDSPDYSAADGIDPPKAVRNTG